MMNILIERKDYFNDNYLSLCEKNVCAIKVTIIALPFVSQKFFNIFSLK